MIQPDYQAQTNWYRFRTWVSPKWWCNLTNVNTHEKTSTYYFNQHDDPAISIGKQTTRYHNRFPTQNNKEHQSWTCNLKYQKNRLPTLILVPFSKYQPYGFNQSCQDSFVTQLHQTSKCYNISYKEILSGEGREQMLALAKRSIIKP